MARLQQRAARSLPRWWSVGIGTALVAAMLFLVVSQALGASLSGSNFEIDTNANLVVDGASPSIDWLTGGSGTAMRAGVVVEDDQPSGSGDDSFKGGVKEDTECGGIEAGSIPPNKSDLLDFGVFTEETAGEKFLHLFWTRVQDPSGSTNMDFEFNQSSVLCSNGVTPVRTEGDLLIQYDLVSGGSQATLSMREWNGTAWGNATTFTSDALGSINTTAIASTNTGGLGSLSARTFGEASINLDLIFDGTTCQSFGSAYLKSRASAQFNSALKDFIAPTSVNISNCADVTVTKVDDAENPIEGVEFTIFVDDGGAPGDVAQDEDGNDLICTTDEEGFCSFGATTAGDYWIDETDGPTGYNKDPDLPFAFTVVADTDVDLEFTNPRQRGRILVLKVDDQDEPLDGAEFTITPGNIEMTPVAGVTGLFCTDDLLFGDYTVSETVTPDGYEPGADEDVTVDTEADCDEATAEDEDVVSVTNTLILDRLIVFSCDADGALIVSEVLADGTTKDTISSVPTALANKGVTAADLCALGGASYDLVPGTYQVDVELPKAP